MTISASRMRNAALRLQWLNHVYDLPTLPPNISTQSMDRQTYDDILQILPGGTKTKLNLKQLRKLAPAPYRAVRFDGKVRFMEFPHPAPYINAVEVLSKHWRDISNTIQNKYSKITPRWHPKDDRIVIFSENYKQPKFAAFDVRSFRRSPRALPLDLSLIRGRALELDIANFFPSIYTHALEWSISGRGKIGSKTVGSEVDQAFQAMRTARTDGISIGPVTSNIAAEILLSKVDKFLIAQAEVGRLNYVRAVDDFTILIRHDEDSTELVNEILAELNRVSLTLNRAKQKEISYKRFYAGHISTMVKLAIIPLLGNLRRDSSRIIFSELQSLSEAEPGKSILKYGWKVVRNSFRKTTKINQMAFLSRSWEMLATAPHLTPQVVSETLRSQMSHSLWGISPYVRSLLEVSLSAGYTDVSCWLIYFANRAQIDIGPVLNKMNFLDGNEIDLLSTWLDSFVALEILHLGDAEYSARLRDIFTNSAYSFDDRTEDWSPFWPVRYELFREKLIEDSDLGHGEKNVFQVLAKNHFSLLTPLTDAKD